MNNFYFSWNTQSAWDLATLALAIWAALVLFLGVVRFLKALVGLGAAKFAADPAGITAAKKEFAGTWVPMIGAVIFTIAVAIVMLNPAIKEFVFSKLSMFVPPAAVG